METTTAWVLYPQGEKDGLSLESFSFPAPTPDECLVEPIYGSWEGNMSHAIRGKPVDICAQRKEDKVVIGNAGLVRVLRPAQGSALREGDLCIHNGGGAEDRYGYMQRAFAYDNPGTIGWLAKRVKTPARALTRVPAEADVRPEQWAAFSLRYPSAWSNQRVALGAWRLQVPEEVRPTGFPVWGWGGGVSFAQLTLAMRRDGAKATMITSRASRVELAERAGLSVVDRSAFADLAFDPRRIESDAEYARSHRDACKAFLRLVHERTDGEGVSIFVDNIGTPVASLTLRALAREGVLATCGWKAGMLMQTRRAVECIARHIHVHTHFATKQDVCDAVDFAAEHGWVPPMQAIGTPWSWDEVPDLAAKSLRGDVDAYFPLYAVNEV